MFVGISILFEEKKNIIIHLEKTMLFTKLCLLKTKRHILYLGKIEYWVVTYVYNLTCETNQKYVILLKIL